MATYTIKTGLVDLLQFPRGASFEISVPMDAEYDMTGKRVEFVIRNRSKNDRRTFTADSTGAYISIASQTTTISIPPATASAADASVSLQDVMDRGEAEYRIDFLTGEGQPVDLRLQGDVNFIEQEGDWND
jgi:putative lipoic acid-binding regulatory protein